MVLKSSSPKRVNVKHQVPLLVSYNQCQCQQAKVSLNKESLTGLNVWQSTLAPVAPVASVNDGQGWWLVLIQQIDPPAATVMPGCYQAYPVCLLGI